MATVHVNVTAPWFAGAISFRTADLRRLRFLSHGAVPALGILSGSLHLTVRGIVLVTILQGIWILLVAAYLLRAQSSSSREQAHGRSI